MAATIAIFDLDGTITRRDSYLAYLLFYLRHHPGRWPYAPAAAAAGVLFGAGLLGHDAMKCAALRLMLAGAERSALARWSDRFVEARSPAMIRPGALARIEGHRRSGDRLMLATASLDIYVEPLARRLGFARTVCTRVAWSETGRLTGGLDGANLRGVHKVTAIEQALATEGGRRDGVVVAYADHHSDLPLLRWADRGTAVNPTARLAAVAAAEGLRVEDWERP
jgi:HAD superfamily hydrolase (TIGR01490 family)